MVSRADQTSLVEARLEAQRIVFGPILFQAARLLRDLGILKALRTARQGLTPPRWNPIVRFTVWTHFTDMTAMIEAAGLRVERVTGNLGVCSSLLICRRR